MTSPAETPRPDDGIAYPVRAVDWIVDDANGKTLAECLVVGAPCEVSVARRIAACLNACRDIGTEDLERCNATPRGVFLALTEFRTISCGSAAREG